eukprot:m.438010 g.438010  ORF g.438010 m.438010 type:complete len:104 (-) comp18183_c0_seq1:148-459(-)
MMELKGCPPDGRHVDSNTTDTTDTNCLISFDDVAQPTCRFWKGTSMNPVSHSPESTTIPKRGISFAHVKRGSVPSLPGVLNPECLCGARRASSVVSKVSNSER